MNTSPKRYYEADEMHGGGISTEQLLYKKLNALRLEVDGSIVDDIKSTVDKLVSEKASSTNQSVVCKTKEEIWQEWHKKDLGYTDMAMGAMEEYKNQYPQPLPAPPITKLNY